ncbi:RNase P subunit p30-domain-containing protein [Myxozyma melibiosi]|uniref:RNase P subunit p30-domain-containing protein n=1 Tax=Myxozyma melibiosi TaxID=54550 RepID=A0ABR1F1W8_9ASCO
MFYDLNIPWPKNVPASATLEFAKPTGPIADLFKTVATLVDLGYTTIAYDYEAAGKTSSITSPIQKDVFAASFPGITFLSRVTLLLDDAAQAQSLPSLTKEFDILAVRPTNEKLLLAACTNLDIDLISVDLSSRLPFYLKHRALGVAVARGIKIEICYSPATRQNDHYARRNLISNAAALFRATRGKGIVISSAAQQALECRGPYDVANLATLWGFTQEKGKLAVEGDARAVCTHARMRRRSYKQVVEIVGEDGDEEKKEEQTREEKGKGVGKSETGKSRRNSKKRKATDG